MKTKILLVGSGNFFLRLNPDSVFVGIDLLNFRQELQLLTVLQEEVSRVTVPVQVPGHSGLDQQVQAAQRH